VEAAELVLSLQLAVALICPALTLPLMVLVLLVTQSGTNILLSTTNNYPAGYYAGGFLPLFAGVSNALTGDLLSPLILLILPDQRTSSHFQIVDLITR
jgi:hypothetical protein